MSSPLLEVKDLQVIVGEENKVLLDGLNLTVNAGETHVLMGHNGAGKSTLMSALMGDPRYTVTRGQIIFRGQDITHETADVRARAGMFLSFQTPEEIPGITLESFLRTAAGAVTGKPVKVMKFRHEMAAQMEALNMDPSYADRYLNVGFSGGEKKKAEILQLLMLKPALVLLDETDSAWMWTQSRPWQAASRRTTTLTTPSSSSPTTPRFWKACRSITSMCWTTPASCAPVTAVWSMRSLRKALPP